MKKITKPDTTNTDPEYWEKVLESHRLGMRQLGLQEPEDLEQEVEEREETNLDLEDGE